MEGPGGAASDTRASSTKRSLLPSLLVFVASRPAVGGSLELAHTRNSVASNTVVGAGPPARLYLAGEGGDMMPYVGVSARVARLSHDPKSGSSPPSPTQWGLEGVAGPTWRFSRRVGIVTAAFARRATYSATTRFGNAGARADVTGHVLDLRVGVAAFIPRGR